MSSDAMSDNVIIDVYVRLPWATGEYQYGYAISRKEAMDALTPLPRNRSIDPYELFEAQRKYDRRASLIKAVSQNIANAIMNACESEESSHEG